MITQFHIQQSFIRTRKDFTWLHEMLDNCTVEPFVDNDKYPFAHRIERHTKEFLEMIRTKYGEDAYTEALKHCSEDGVWL